MKRIVSMNGSGTIIIFTNMNAKIEPKGTRKKSGFRFLSPATTESTVINPKAITQIISFLLWHLLVYHKVQSSQNRYKTPPFHF